MHWRRKDDSPLVGFLARPRHRRRFGGDGHGRVSRHARRLCRMARRSAPPAGAGTTCCLTSASSRTNSISAVRCTARTVRCRSGGPRAEDWAPLAKAVHVFAQERQIPFIADMNADFRDGYGAVPMSNWPRKRGSAAICYLDAPTRRRDNLTIISAAFATGLLFEGRRAVGVNGEDRRRRKRVPWARHHRRAGRHSLAGIFDARRDRRGEGTARARHRGARRSAGRGQEPLQPRHSCSSACCRSPARGRRKKSGRIR